jgi:hypothetical protein
VGQNDPKDTQVILHLLKTGATQRYLEPLVTGHNDLQELANNYQQVSLRKIRLHHAILTHHLPMYFPEAERYRTAHGPNGSNSRQERIEPGADSGGPWAVGIIAQSWLGKNIDAYFGGNGQGIYETAAGRVDGVVGRGFFVGGNAFVSQNIWLSAFYSYERNNLPDLVNAGIPFRIASGAFSGSTFGSPGVGHGRDGYVAVWFNPLPSLYTGVGWDYRQASYNDGDTGRNNRFNLSVFYNFCTAQVDRRAKLPWLCRTGGQTRDEGNPGQP